MEQRVLSISDASKRLEVNPKMLRNWEEKLALHIPRNEHGHRCYGSAQIHTMEQIIQLKKKGLQLRAIKVLLPKMDQIQQLPEDQRQQFWTKLEQELPQEVKKTAMETGEKDLVVLSPAEKQEENTTMVECTTQLETGEKMQQFQRLLRNIIEDALESKTNAMSKEIVGQVGEQLKKELDYQFRMQEEKAEMHYRKIDEMLRSKQKKKVRKHGFRKGTQLF